MLPSAGLLPCCLAAFGSSGGSSGGSNNTPFFDITSTEWIYHESL
jgi:hypothetical protein